MSDTMPPMPFPDLDDDDWDDEDEPEVHPLLKRFENLRGYFSLCAPMDCDCCGSSFDTVEWGFNVEEEQLHVDVSYGCYGGASAQFDLTGDSVADKSRDFILKEATQVADDVRALEAFAGKLHQAVGEYLAAKKAAGA